MKKINLDFIEDYVKKENEKITEQDMAHYLRNKGNEIYELYKYINKLAEDLEKGNSTFRVDNKEEYIKRIRNFIKEWDI
ncbi:hypothetical protein [Clostridium paraputrificum]|uniref:hypothetical protein n=1 Tax=Clostridium paraputrificum TaxID=29363 RepID=UPI00374E81E8